MDIVKILSSRIFKRKQKIFFDEYLKEIIKNIENLILHNSGMNKPQLILTLEKENIEFIIILIAGIIKFYENLTNSNDILNTISIGDIVVYNKKKYIFMGEKVINNKSMIELKARNTRQEGHECGSTEFIGKTNISDISIYYGDSNKLGHIREKTNTLNNYSNIFKKMFHNSNEFTNRIINEQLVVVFENKKHMQNILSNYFIQIEGTKYNFEEVFPCKYYTGEDKFVDLKNDVTNGLFLFTSKLEVANEILLSNKNCKTLILFGEKTYKDRIETTLSRLFKRLSKNKLSNIIIHNNYNEINEIDNLLNKDIKCYSWGREVINYNYNINKKYINSYNTVNKFFKYEVENQLIENNEINELFNTINKDLINVLKNGEDIYDVKTFLICAYKMFNELQDYVYPIKIYDNNDLMIDIETNDEVILNRVLNENEEYIENYNLLNSIIQNIKELKSILYNKNPKIRKLKKISDNTSTIVCKNEKEKQMLNNENKLEYKKIITKEELDYEAEDETFIFLSTYKKTKEFQYAYIKKNKIINILNYVQAKNYNSRAKFINRLIDAISRKNLLTTGKLDNYVNQYLPIIKLKQKNMEDNEAENNEDYNVIEIYINKEIENFNYEEELNKLKNLKFSKIYSSQDNEYTGTNLAIKKIFFTDGSYSYITKNSKIILLDDENNVCGNINECKLYDRALYIDEKTDNDLNILFDQIVNSKVFKESYKNHYENMIYWKKSLEKYIEDYELTYSDIVNELCLYNISKSEQTIRGWLKSESVIGPWEQEFYEALGKITCDQRLLDNWQVIYESNNKIRGFRRLFRNTFRNMIQNEVCNNISNKDELEILVNKVFGNLREYAKIVKIIKIEQIHLELPYVQTNCLIYDK